MSTFQFTITINESEMIALRASLELMIEHCQQKLDEGAGAPYWARKESAKSILDKLYKNPLQTSGNNFFDDK
jgi:hypothetical protein